MKKVLVFAAVFVGLGLVVRRFGREMRNIDWEERLEAMPDNSPPKWMFRNITAIRDNTDRILELLERNHPGSGGPAADEPRPVRDESPAVSEVGAAPAEPVDPGR